MKTTKTKIFIIIFLFSPQVNVTVEDENDNPPVFERQWYEGRVEENALPGTEVKLENPLKIQDADAGVNALFIVMIKGNGSEAFMIDQKTHRVSVRDGAMLDRESRDAYYLRLIAKDRGTSAIPRFIKFLLKLH